MRPETSDITSESKFYQALRDTTYGRISYERVEPATESGFPDTAFICRRQQANIFPTVHLEGTIELKFEKNAKINLKSKLEGNQIAAFLEYYERGGRTRFVLAYVGGKVLLWSTGSVVKAILKHPDEVQMDLHWGTPKFTDNLIGALEVFGRFNYPEEYSK